MSALEPQRVRAARESLDTAIRQERLARIAAAPALRNRARRRRAALRIGMATALIVTLVAAGIALWATLSASSLRDTSEATDDAVAAASGAVVTMLTPDPANAEGYLAAITDVSTGPQRTRFDQNHGAIAEYVRALTVRPEGRIVSAGAARRDGADVDVLLVAQATDPTLVGGRQGQQRVALRVSMARIDGDWRVADTERL
ncbi:hypothetical protein JVX90_14480 [Gordonia sp. PDNC005]|uniref:hypothetical protein n=1 Tax=unclassified Gordonia (in: high G+C Gram-positive bacteria) TaxID=2657482 RepID=UPI0019662E45|nr:hypothetical protein [Gordonia sp. PDNC005]QRY61613.1 hypothetical protein JVX90_14480 [Gordonia sp. PDNC005]